MSASRSMHVALREHARSEATVRGAEERSKRYERELTLGEQHLGSEAQVSGELGSADTVPYTDRWRLDEKLAAQEAGGAGSANWGYKGGMWHHMDPRAKEWYRGAMKERGVQIDDLGYAWGGDNEARKYTGGVGAQRLRIEQANDMMSKAEEAARAGNMEEAEKLREQAEDFMTAGIAPGSEKISDPEASMKAKLSSPLAQTVGSELRSARQLQDFESEYSQDFIRRQTEPLERQAAAQQRQMARSQRDLGLMGGTGARQILNQQAVAGRDGAVLAAQKAQARAVAVSGWYDMKSRAAKDATGLARDFLQGQAGIREQHQDRQDNYASATAELAQINAQRFFQKAAAEKAAEDAEKANRTQRIISGAISVAALIAAPFTGGATLPIAFSSGVMAAGGNAENAKMAGQLGGHINPFGGGGFGGGGKGSPAPAPGT